MEQQRNGTLAEMMEKAARQATDEAHSAIEGLVASARELEMRETVDRLVATAEQLRADTFNLMVMGRFKNGKSTLLNALLGGVTHPVDLKGHQGPMVVDDLPATAVLTGVRYSEKPQVEAYHFEGKPERWSLERYLRESVLDVDEAENDRRFRNISAFDMGFPARLCKAGVMIFDSPGLDEHPTRTKVTQEAMRRCDAALIVYRSDVLMGQNELMNASDLVREGTGIFTVVNLFHGRPADDRIRGYVWNKYVRDHLGGPAWSGQDPASQGIYFVDAERARVGVYTGNKAEVEASGLAALERRLADFLLNERHHVHLKKYTTQATHLAKPIEQHIGQRIQAARTDQSRLRERYAAVLPELTSIRNRPAALPALFSRSRTQAEDALASSLISRIAAMRKGLSAHVNDVEVNLGRMLGVVQQKKAASVVAQSVQQYVSDGLAQWAEEDAQEVLAPLLKDLSSEVEKEIATIGRQFEALHLELTGWEFASGDKPLVGTLERWASAAGGFLVGGLGGAVAGGTVGWRGAAGGAGGAFGAAFLLGVLGVSPAAPVVIPVVMAASLVGSLGVGSLNLERRLKDKAVADADNALRDLPSQLIGEVGQKIRGQFDDLEVLVTADIVAAIDEEERSIRLMVEENQRDQQAREQQLARLGELKAAVAGHLFQLQKALSTAQQV
ncbi:dynamin family protein [Streptomyces sp. NPDC014891]|uniref:dynamin family protein n=1 Tax=Streptomyces sp. NPDC014891 TaxID=3364929 RepID=UPI0036FF00FB